MSVRRNCRWVECVLEKGFQDGCVGVSSAAHFPPPLPISKMHTPLCHFLFFHRGFPLFSRTDTITWLGRPQLNNVKVNLWCIIISGVFLYNFFPSKFETILAGTKFIPTTLIALSAQMPREKLETYSI